MKKLYLLLLPILPAIWSCDTEEIGISEDCLYSAVIEDFSSLDGCGYLFKLSNGEYLEPVRTIIWCGTPPLPDEYYEDALNDFQLEDGKKVRIGFKYVDNYGSACMKGKMAIITCIEAVEEEVDDEDIPL